jgi:hypothetical protein
MFLMMKAHRDNKRGLGVPSRAVVGPTPVPEIKQTQQQSDFFGLRFGKPFEWHWREQLHSVLNIVKAAAPSMLALPSSSEDDDGWGIGITIFISHEAKSLWRKGEVASRHAEPVFETFLHG